MNYGYIRVSTDKQDTENQKWGIIEYCKKNNITIDEWHEETVSGKKDYHKRDIANILSKAKKDDLIVCTELSRLSRDMLSIMSILNDCMARGINVWTVKNEYRLGNNMQSKVLAFAFGIAAEIERDLISQRTKEALSRKKSEGVVLGRRKGSVARSHKLDGYACKISDMLTSGKTRAEVVMELGISRTTLENHLKRMNKK